MGGVAGKSSWFLLFRLSACPPSQAGYGESRAHVLCGTLVGPKKSRSKKRLGIPGVHTTGKREAELEQIMENPWVERTDFIYISFQEMFYKLLPVGHLKLFLPFRRDIKVGIGRHLETV